MSSRAGTDDREYRELVFLYALHALPSSEIPRLQAHLGTCADCRRELEALAPVVDAFVSWPADVLRPTPSLWERLQRRIANEGDRRPATARSHGWALPEWEEAAPAVSCKVLATDTDNSRVSLLVRLAPGAAYPPHQHADVEELYLLDGELMIDDRKLYPGDYNRAEPGTSDSRVWSETGCTCVLITSTRDELR
jgi:ChrR Cupin-like domain/Putative zinc-finger